MMSNTNQNDVLIRDLTEEQIDAVAGGSGELMTRYLSIESEDTKGGGDRKVF